MPIDWQEWRQNLPATTGIQEENVSRYLKRMTSFLILDVPNFGNITETEKRYAADELLIHYNHLSNLHLRISQSQIGTALLGLATAVAAVAFPPFAAGIALGAGGLITCSSVRSWHLQTQIKRTAKPLLSQISVLRSMLAK
jgi:hypothetical protein